MRSRIEIATFEGGMPTNLLKPSSFLLLPLLILSACQQEKVSGVNKTFGMGERIDIGPFTYVVVEAGWASQLGEGFQVRSARERFLVVNLSVQNNSNAEVSIPMLSVEGSNGKTFQELSDGTGLSQWLGVLRGVAPSQPLQGRIVFDVPLSSFRLRLPDGGETGYEKYAYVDIPLRIDADQVQAPLPGPQVK
ncbi:MAG: DUF4352 domain-containing protein [Acidobacteriota bacterium]